MLKVEIKYRSKRLNMQDINQMLRLKFYQLKLLCICLFGIDLIPLQNIVLLLKLLLIIAMLFY